MGAGVGAGVGAGAGVTLISAVLGKQKIGFNQIVKPKSSS